MNLSDDEREQADVLANQLVDVVENESSRVAIYALTYVLADALTQHEEGCACDIRKAIIAYLKHAQDRHPGAPAGTVQ